MPRRNRQKWKPFNPNVEDDKITVLRRSSRLEKSRMSATWADIANPSKKPPDKKNLEESNLDKFYQITKSGTKLQISDVRHLIKERLRQAGFMLSPSQDDTKGDGNCFLYATEDQLR